MKTEANTILTNYLTCVLRVCFGDVVFNKSIHQTKYHQLIPAINNTTITTKYLKNIYTILLFVCFPFLLSHAQKKPVDLRSCLEGKSVQYFYLEGNISSVGCLFKNKPVGVWRSFYESGEIKSFGLRDGENLEGEWIFFYLNLEISKIINYYNGEKNGLETTYSEEGILLVKSNWILNIKEGEEQRFYKTGELKNINYYKNGLKEGKSIKYSKDGRIIGFVIYKKGIVYSSDSFNRFNKKGEKSGIWKEFYENIKLQEEGPFIDGLRNGIFRYYDKRGNLDDIIHFELGVKKEDSENSNIVDVIRRFHINGTISQETILINGLKNGVTRSFDEKGQIISGGEYKEGLLTAIGITLKTGEKQGKWIFFYDDHEKKSEGFFVNGLKEGEWIYYFISGEVEQKGFYRNGQLDKEWNWWSISGEILRTENYDFGKEEGEFIELNIEGKTISKGVYKNGLKEGFWIYHVNDHREEGKFINGEFDGNWRHWYSDNQLKFEGKYSFGQPEGKHKHYFSNGLVNYYGGYESGVKHGKWCHFNDEGIIKHLYKYKYGELIKVDGRRVSKTKKYTRP